MAITYRDSQNGGSSTWPITSGAYSTAVQTGDLLICATLYVQGSGATLTMSDNLNSGNYTNVLNTSYGAGSLQLTVGYKVATATGTAGTTQITVTGGSNGNYAAMILLRYNGFVYTPTPVAADTFSNTGHTSGPATIAGFNNSDAAELLVAFIQTASGSTTFGSPGAAWNGRSGANNSQSWDQILTTSGNAISFSSALNQLDYWLDGVVAFADGPPTITLAQSATGYSSTTAVTSQSGTFGSATNAGAAIFVVTTNANGNTVQPTGFSDVVNGAYIPLSAIYDSTGGIYYASFYFPNAKSLSPSNNLTVAVSGSAGHVGFAAYEIDGVGVNPLVAYSVNIQTNVTSTAANLLTSTTLAGGSVSAIGVAVCSGFGINQGPPLTGTGFTACPAPGGAFWQYTANNVAAGEYQYYPSGGSVTATFTAGGTTSDDYVTLLAVFSVGTNSATVAWVG